MKLKFAIMTLVLVGFSALMSSPAHAGAVTAKPAFTHFTTVELVAVPNTGGGGGGSGCGDVCFYNDAGFLGTHGAIINMARGTCYNMSSTFAGHISSQIINIGGVIEFRGTNCGGLNRVSDTRSSMDWPWNDAIYAYGIPN